MKKKRIIILMHYMELGGAEMALLGLLHALDYEKVDVDLFIYSHRGELMPFIPEQVNILPELPAYAAIECPMKQALLKGHLGVVCGRLRAKLAHREFLRHNAVPDGVQDASVFGYVGHYVSPRVPHISPEKEYDLAVSFLTPHNFCADHVRAGHKVAWIHTDYSKVLVDKELELPVWNQFDSIIAISDDVARTFAEAFPSLAGKLTVIENILPAEYIRRRAQEPMAENLERGELMLLSIGRFTYPKNFDNIPGMARFLVENHGIDVRWYVIGYGGDEELIRRRVAQEGMERHVIIIGKRDNPYPYINACDIYVQPSRYEGKSITVREAQTLCKPVVITRYPTAASQVNDGVNGVICDLDNEAVADAVEALFRDADRRRAIIRNLQPSDFAMLSEADKLLSIIP